MSEKPKTTPQYQQRICELEVRDLATWEQINRMITAIRALESEVRFHGTTIQALSTDIRRMGGAAIAALYKKDAVENLNFALNLTHPPDTNKKKGEANE